MSTAITTHEKNDAMNGISIIFYIGNAVFFAAVLSFSLNMFSYFKNGYLFIHEKMRDQLLYETHNVSMRNHAIFDFLNKEKITMRHDAALYENSAEKNTKGHLADFGHIKFSQNKKNAKKIVDAVYFFTNTWNILLESTKLVFLKLLSVALSSLFLLLSSILGAGEGLLSRYIRKKEGGRESAFLFHRISKLFLKLPFFILFIYMASPILLNPELVILLISAMIFYFSYLYTSSLKKYI